MLPTAFLPTLPKAQYTLHPLDPREIASLTSILRELYLPPVHGGLSAADAFYDDADDDNYDQAQAQAQAQAEPNGDATGQREQEKKIQRRFSQGLVESIGRLDLGGIGRSHLAPDSVVEDGGATPRAVSGSGAATPIPISRFGSRMPHGSTTNRNGTHMNDLAGKVPTYGDDDDDDDDHNSEGSTDEEDEDEGEGDTAHLDPFEREWAQKWLQGVVRRAQTWIEQTGDALDVEGGETTDADGYDMKSVEGVLKDATAVLAVMAGTGAAGSLTRHLLFPLAPSLVPGLHAQQTLQAAALHTAASSPSAGACALSLSHAAYSPETRTFLASLAHRSRARSGTVGSAATSTSAASASSASTGTLSTSTPSSPESPTTQLQSRSNRPRTSRKRQRTRRPAIPILLHDAPISDHLDVGVQTWGSAILLGRELALRPEKFGLLPLPGTPAEEVFRKKGTRVLELGAGTGLLGILCRKLLDLHTCTTAAAATDSATTEKLGSGQQGGAKAEAASAGKGHLVLATDFLPSVLGNLAICVDLNFPASSLTTTTIPLSSTATGATRKDQGSGGVEIAKLDWVTFPAFAERYHASQTAIHRSASPAGQSSRCTTANGSFPPHRTASPAIPDQLKYPLERQSQGQSHRTLARPDASNHNGHAGVRETEEQDAENPMMPYMKEPFDLVLVSDCVYDPTHAEMIRNVAGCVLRPPNPEIEGDLGGTMHILSPLRPTFAPELESIDTFFPVLSSYPPLSSRLPSSSSSAPHHRQGHGEGEGEGLGYAQGLRVGTRGTGKRSVRGRKGEGRVDEVGGYWWWEVGWG